MQTELFPTNESNQNAEQIAEQLRKADSAYYTTGNPIMEDAVYDALKEKIRRLDPDHTVLRTVGHKPNEMLALVKHTIPMGSQNKATNYEEFIAWAKTLPSTGTLCLSYKMDGGSIALDYVGGNLVRAATRGDGFQGEDITQNALKFKNCPKTGLRFNNVLFTGSIRAEILLSTEDWKTVDPDLESNPRNLAVGIARRKSGHQAEHITVCAFKAYQKNGEPLKPTESATYQALDEAGFKTPKNAAYDITWPKSDIPIWIQTHNTLDTIWEFIKEAEKQRSTLPFWIDGVIVSVDDIKNQLAMGETDQRPKGQIAVKFEPRCFKTTARDIILTVGHTGAIIPTLVFDPVRIDGTTVSNASLSNWNKIAELNIAIGDTINVYKAGDIIPQVMEVLERPPHRKPIPKPQKCPVCGGPAGHKTTVAGEQSAAIYCLNEDCPTKLPGKINRFITSLDIRGIGDEILEALINTKILKSPAELYTLRNNQTKLAQLPIGEKGITLGAKRAATIIEEIKSRRELTIAELLGSLGIDGLGKRRVILVQEAAPDKFDTLEKWMDGNLAHHATEAGLPNLGKTINEHLMKLAPLIQQFLANGVTIKQTTPPQPKAQNTKSFCLTGTLSKPRDHYIQLIQSKGHTYRDGVSKGLDYLVMADPSSASSKATKARKLGTQCISEAELLQILS